MRVALTLAVLALALVAAPAFAKRHHSSDVIDASNIDAAFAHMPGAEASLKHDFEAFKRRHSREYASAEEEQYRFVQFKNNMARAAELQRLNPEASFGAKSPYADMHPLEFKRAMRNYQPLTGERAHSRLRRQVRATTVESVAALPTNFDWRNPGDGRPVGVTPVKDQGQCGSCWAFSATEAIESAYILAGHKPVDLAPEQIVDCDVNGSDAGCNGGDTIGAYEYIEGVGLMSEASYPYTAGTTGNAGSCQYNSSEVVAKISSYVYATPGCTDSCTNQNEALLKQNLYEHAPVSICVDASTWQTYESGILTSASGCGSAYSNLDHCVQLVGFGTDPSNGKQFWSVRNSWNTNWGEAGYIRLLYGANTCGVADEATLPTIAKA